MTIHDWNKTFQFQSQRWLHSNVFKITFNTCWHWPNKFIVDHIIIIIKSGLMDKRTKIRRRRRKRNKE